MNRSATVQGDEPRSGTLTHSKTTKQHHMDVVIEKLIIWHFLVSLQHKRKHLKL